MKTTAINMFRTAAFAMLLALTGCGSNSSSTSPTTGTVTSQGVITAKGSIFVNGIEYATNNAAITVDDNPGTESDLKVGMTVRVRGTSDDAAKTGTAVKVEVRSALKGPIDSIDTSNKTITVMGQTVQIEDNVTRLNDDDTVKLFAAAGLAVGNLVEVNGFADDNGGLRATRVARKATMAEFEAKGYITSLTASSFGLSVTPGGTPTLTVNYSAGILPAGAANNSPVEVKASAAPLAGAITALAIHLEDKLGANGDNVEVEGIVSSGTVTDFIIQGQRVLTDSSTLFEGGLSSDFATGVKLEAEGRLNADGSIVARKITYRSTVKIEADASGVSATGLTVLGKPVAIGTTTRIDGTLTDGSHVEIRAGFDRNGNLLASRIIVKSGSAKVFIQGPLTAADSTNGTLTILGTPYLSDSSSQWRLSSSSSDLPATKAEFYSRLQLNVSIVKIRWNSFSADTDPFKEAEIELGK